MTCKTTWCHSDEMRFQILNSDTVTAATNLFETYCRANPTLYQVLECFYFMKSKMVFELVDGRYLSLSFQNKRGGI